MGLLDDILNAGKELLKREAGRMLSGSTGTSGRKRTSSRRTSGSSRAPGARKRNSTTSRAIDDARWFGADQATRVHGLVIGQHVYVGTRLTATRGSGNEPSLIGHHLSVQPGKATPVSGNPNFATFSPAQRWAYLHWLAAGRRDVNADPMFPKLYVYGLERRVFVELADGAGSRAVTGELQRIREELLQLIATYGEWLADDSTPLRDAITALLAQSGGALEGASIPFPRGLQLELLLAKTAANDAPLTPELAWTWATRDKVPTVIRRNLEMSRALFMHRVREAPALRISMNRRGKEIRTIKPANPAVKARDFDLSGFPIWADAGGAFETVNTILVETAAEIASYDKLIRSGSFNQRLLPHLATIPAALHNPSHPRVQAFRQWLEHHVPKSYGSPVATKLLWQEWDASMEKPSAAQSRQLADMLQRCGYGIQPDRRVGWENPGATGKIVLFRLPNPLPAQPSPSLDRMLLQLQFAAAVSMADGRMNQQELNAITAFIEAAEVHPSERAHLYARLIWISLRPIKLTGLTRMIAQLTTAETDALSAFLIDVAACDGTVEPEQMDALMRIWTLLKRDPKEISRTLHHSMTSVPGSAPGAIDHEQVKRTQQETAVVSELLSELFTDDSPDVVQEATAVASVESSFGDLLTVVMAQESWSAEAFADAAARYGLMPGAALDGINQRSLDACGEPILEHDGEGYTLNTWARDHLQQ